MLGLANSAASLLAQSAGSGGPPPAFLLLFIGIAFIIWVGIQVLLVWFMFDALRKIPQPYQQMSPGLVWLMLIPLFNLVWAFFVVLKISGSFQNYFLQTGRPQPGDYGRSIGLAYAICAVCVIIPILGSLAGLASLICVILFLVKITGLKKLVGIDAPGFPVTQ